MAMKESALGLIETYGFVGAVEALDVAVKSANVELLSCEFIKAGIVTIIITGDVSSVNSAVAASTVAAEKIGVLRNSHVIARAYDEMWGILQGVKNSCSVNVEKDESEKINISITEDAYENTGLSEAVQESKESHSELQVQEYHNLRRNREELEKFKVTKLRTIARGIKNISLTKNQIKFSKKEELIDAILMENTRR